MTDTPGLQFETADGAEAAGPQTCQGCAGPLAGQYWVVNQRVACTRCKTALETTGGAGDGFVRFVKATLLGIGGGIVGAGVWYLVQRFTGYQIGLIAILVGFLVGGGVRMGSQARGGWLYQLLAIVLTYASIVVAWFPVAVAEMKDDPEVGAGIKLYFIAAVIAIVAPLVNSVIGALITLFALYEAWKMNKKTALEITGPHAMAPAGPPALPPGPPPLG